MGSTELASKVGWIPGEVVKAIAFREDWELRARVLELMDAYIVPKGEGELGVDSCFCVVIDWLVGCSVVFDWFVD